MATRLTSQPLPQKARARAHTHYMNACTHTYSYIFPPLHLSVPFLSPLSSSLPLLTPPPGLPPSLDFTFHSVFFLSALLVSSFHFLTLALLPPLVFLFSSFPLFIPRFLRPFLLPLTLIQRCMPIPLFDHSSLDLEIAPVRHREGRSTALISALRSEETRDRPLQTFYRTNTS